MKSIPFEKRIKAPENKKMYWGSPNSKEVKTLPAGQPSPPIDSYILASGGWYQLGPVNGENLYLKDTEDLVIVEPTAPDESNYFTRIWNQLGDTLENTVTDIEDGAGYVSEGFDKATSDLGKDLTGFGGEMRNVLLVGVALLVLVSIAIITSKFN